MQGCGATLVLLLETLAQGRDGEVDEQTLTDRIESCADAVRYLISVTPAGSRPFAMQMVGQSGFRDWAVAFRALPDAVAQVESSECDAGSWLNLLGLVQTLTGGE